MIQVQKLTIKEFRGIHDLAIDFKGKNFAICGPNGTGKSGVVDALEFALTGGISRLSGKGTGDVSVAKHAPHVDSRNRPDKAKVILQVWIPSLKKSATIERSVKDSNSPVIKPADPLVAAVFRQAALHPEFALSRRELIRYVLSSPGDRAKEVQTLLRLDVVEDIRAVFLRVSNANQKEIKPLSQEKAQAKQQLLRALEIADLNEAELLTAVNVRRTLLGLFPIKKLAATTSLRDGLAARASTPQARVSKTQAKSDLESLRATLVAIASANTRERSKTITEGLKLLEKDAALMARVHRERFLEAAIRYIESETCPVCDTQWAPGELEARVRAKLDKLKEAARKRADAEKDLQPILDCIRSLSNTIPPVERLATLLVPAISTDSLKKLRELLKSKSDALEAFLPLSSAIQAIENLGAGVEVADTITEIQAALDAIPEPTEQEAAQVYLTVSQERLDAFRAVSLRLKTAEEHAALSKRIYDAYVRASTSVLEGIYKEVEKDFSNLYRYINRDDENSFSAHLTPSLGKLGFDVDFYGRGFFPPGAYHSEGHQDGMGLCLYLALMRHLLGTGFTFAVLDDVLMSVDTGHRREVCNLLREQFPDTQFVLTTHDKIWLKHMEAVGVVPPGALKHFRKWDVDHGPMEWDGRDIWREIDDELKRGQVHVAASLLRNFLEFLSATIAHSIRARVEYREDAHYQLGDLLPAVIERFRKLLKEGKETAASWGKPVDEIENRERVFDERVLASDIEQWAINPAIHYNQWANFESSDFAPVVGSYHRLCESFSCPSCFGLTYVTPQRGPKEALRCVCGDVNINLLRKKAKPKATS